MSLLPVDAALAEFGPDDYTPRMIDAIFKVVPYSPTLQPYTAIEDAVRALDPAATAVHYVRAREMSAEKDLQDVLWMASLLDTGDKGLALYSGLRSAFDLVRGNANALETDTRQRNDAVLKALGLGYMAWNAFPGGVAERAEAFRSTSAGQALLLYYASVEVALPFADNAAVAGGNFLQQLFDREGSAQAGRLAQLAGGRSLEGATAMLGAITGGIQRVVDHAAVYTRPVAEAAQQYLPGAMTAADRAAGVVATAADVMPVYRYLGARLVAEASALRAMR